MSSMCLHTSLYCVLHSPERIDNYAQKEISGVGRKSLYCVCLLLALLLSACGSQSSQGVPPQPLTSDGMIAVEQHPTPTPALQIPSQITTPTPKPATVPPSSPPGSVPTTGTGIAPY